MKVEVYPGQVNVYVEIDTGTLRESITRDGMLIEMLIGDKANFVTPVLSKTIFNE